MESQFGLIGVWAQGDWVTRARVPAAAGHVAGVLDRHPHQGAGPVAATRNARPARPRRFWHAEDFADGLAKLGSDPATTRSASSPSKAAKPRRPAAPTQHPAHLHDSLDVSDWVTRCLRNSASTTSTARLQSGLAVLASVGSTAPVRRPVRHGLGHLPRADGHRRGRPGHHRQGGRPDRRGADHDGPGPGGGHSGRAGLQRAGARQQGVLASSTALPTTCTPTWSPAPVSAAATARSCRMKKA
jgi:hypothetical protein